MALTTNLLYYYKLDGNSTDSVASANGTDTSITYSSGNGKIDQGAGFNGSTSKIALPNNDWSQSTGFSVSAWVKSSASTDQMIIARDNVSGTGRMFFLRLELTTGKAEFLRFDSSTSVVTDIKSSSAYNDGNWHHIVATFDNTIGSKIYVDGTSVASDAVTTNNVSGANSVPYIGIFNGASSQMNGAIDEVGIWNRGITSAEVTQLYNSGNGNQYPFPTYNFIISTLSFTYSLNTIGVIKSFISSINTLAFTYTLNNVIFGRITSFLVNTLSFTLTLSPISSIVHAWQNLQTKTSATWSDATKTISTWINRGKNQ